MAEANELEEVSGDGLAKARVVQVDPALLEAIDNIKVAISAVNDRRRTNADIRYCRWDGQSDDGRKRSKAMGKEAMPYEGASDTRVRLADKIINERVTEYVAAAIRNQISIGCEDSSDNSQSRKMQAVLRWLRKSQWGDAYRREIELAAQWMEGDTPAISLMGVFWAEEKAVELREISTAELLNQYIELVVQQAQAQGEQLDPALANDYIDILQNPARSEEAAAMVSTLYPELKPARVTQVVKDLYLNGTAQFPVSYTRKKFPELTALRMYEDIFFPDNVEDLQRAPHIFVRRWFSATDVRESAAREGWSEKFVEELLGEEGRRGKEAESAFDPADRVEDGALNNNLFSTTKERAGLYEVVWCYSRAARDDGGIGIYVQVFSGLCKTAATNRTLLEYRHGKYPFIPFPRETLTRRLLNSRSDNELALTQQGSIKLLTDTVEDHAQVLTNPPLKKPRGSPKYRAMLAPFGECEVGPRETLEFIQRPAYPEAAVKHREFVQTETDDYFGRDNETLPNLRAQLARQLRVDKFLGYLSEVMTMALQLCQQYMSDEDLARIANIPGVPRTVREIQGKFDLSVTVDVRDMDQEFLFKKGELMLKYLRPLDPQGVLPWDVYLKNFVAGIDPTWADAIQPEGESRGRIEKDEADNYVRILAGVEMPMPEMIDGPQIRLQTLQNLHQPRMQNPQAFGPVSLAAQAILENRIKYLQFQAQQAQNAIIGRVGATPTDMNKLAAAPGQQPAEGGPQ